VIPRLGSERAKRGFEAGFTFEETGSAETIDAFTPIGS